MRQTTGGGRLSEAAIAAHDLQRRLPAAAENALIDGLRGRLAGLGRGLDAGIGTGAVARPLARAGVPLVGIDSSRAMLHALVAEEGGRAPFPLARGDLVRLPFADGSFGATVAANVLHLIAAWEQALTELARVTRPGGLLLVNLGGGVRSETAAALLARFRLALGGTYAPDGETAGLGDAADVEARLARHGAVALAPFVVRGERWRTPEQEIVRLEHNPFAWGGEVDPAALRAAATATRAWARRHLGPLDAAHRSGFAIAYRVYRR